MVLSGPGFDGALGLREIKGFARDAGQRIAAARRVAPFADVAELAARAGLASVLVSDPSRWPWATFIVNIVGAFLLGYFTTRLLERLPLSSYRRPMLGTGLCGGLTTFSTMQVETLKMIEAHHYGLAAGYTVASIAAGLAAVYAATVLVRRVRIRA